MTRTKQLAERALELSEKASPGPWESYDLGVMIDGILHRIETENPMIGDSSNDTEFIAESRSLLPAIAKDNLKLLEENKVMREALEWYKDRHVVTPKADGNMYGYFDDSESFRKPALEALAKADGIRNGGAG